MNKPHRIIPFVILLTFSFIAHAEEVVPDADFWSALLALLGGIKGMGGLAIAVGLVQLGMVFLKTSYGSFAGKWKLVAVAALSVIGAVLAGLASGLPLMASLLNGTVIAAVQVLVNEVIKHLKEDKSNLVNV
jgi:hypothetical protein